MLAPHLVGQQQKAHRRHALSQQGIPPDADGLTLAEIQRKRAERQRRRTAGRRQADLERVYRQYATRKLLAMPAEAREWWWLEDDERSIEEWALKNVLASRPHVQRKREGHRQRQTMATRQHGQGKARNR